MGPNGQPELVQLLTSIKDSLEREIRDGFSQMTIRFDDQAARLDRHAGYWETGRRWSGRMERLRKLEEGNTNAQ